MAAPRSMVLHQNIRSCQKHTALSSFTETQQNSPEHHFNKKPVRTATGSVEFSRASVPLDSQDLAAPLLGLPGLHFIASSSATKSHISRKRKEHAAQVTEGRNVQCKFLNLFN